MVKTVRDAPGKESADLVPLKGRTVTGQPRTGCGGGGRRGGGWRLFAHCDVTAGARTTQTMCPARVPSGEEEPGSNQILQLIPVTGTPVSGRPGLEAPPENS